MHGRPSKIVVGVLPPFCTRSWLAGGIQRGRRWSKLLARRNCFGGWLMPKEIGGLMEALIGETGRDPHDRPVRSPCFSAARQTSRVWHGSVPLGLQLETSLTT